MSIRQSKQKSFLPRHYIEKVAATSNRKFRLYLRDLSFAKNLFMIAQIFQDAAESTSNHRKCASRLIKAVRDQDAAQAFFVALLPLLQAKKSVVNTELVYTFMELFFKNLNTIDDEEFDSIRKFRTALIEYLIKGLAAGNKVVRWRSCQLLSSYIGYTEAIRENEFALVTKAVLDRVQDKDHTVRIAAVSILTRIQVNLYV